MKASEWKKNVDIGEGEDEDVVIFIELPQWKAEERKLKAKRGKRVPLKISNQAPYIEVLSKGIIKWKTYHTNDFIEQKEYTVVYPDGQEALFLPGTKEFFFSKTIEGRDWERL